MAQTGKIDGAHRRTGINMLTLLELGKKYGIDREGISKIAEELGKSKETTKKYISEYCIKENLEAGILEEW